MYRQPITPHKHSNNPLSTINPGRFIGVRFLIELVFSLDTTLVLYYIMTLITQLVQPLSHLFPDLEPLQPLRLLGEGFSSLVVETAGGIVFRIAKNSGAAASHALEIRLLPALAGRLPLAVPQPRWYTGPSPDFPFGLMGYSRLPGQPLTPALFATLDVAQLALDLAAFLLALHRFPIEEARALGLPGPEDRRAAWAQLRTDVLPPLRQALARGKYQMIVRWWDSFLADQAMQTYPAVLQHGDLWYENMLVDHGKLVGILDFENAAIGDPAQDFITLLYLGRPFLDQVVAAYQAGGGTLGDHFPHRLARLWELREFGGLQYTVRYHDAEELEDSLRKICQGPILNPETRYDYFS